MRVDWSRRALRDVEEIYEYLADFNPTAAERVVRRLALQADNLEYFPQRGRPVPGTDLRELVVVYPYIIRYRIAGDEVLILRVRHGRRRP